jgi:hypothetical protein
MGAFSEWAVAHAWNGYVAVRSFPAILAIAERISVNVAFANSVVAVRVVTLRRSRCVLALSAFISFRAFAIFGRFCLHANAAVGAERLIFAKRILFFKLTFISLEIIVTLACCVTAFQTHASASVIAVVKIAARDSIADFTSITCPAFVALAVGSCVVLESDAIAIIITKVECDAGIHFYHIISAIATGET